MICCILSDKWKMVNKGKYGNNDTKKINEFLEKPHHLSCFVGIIYNFWRVECDIRWIYITG